MPDKNIDKKHPEPGTNDGYWDTLHRRMHQAAHDLEKGLTLSPGERENILEKRAAALAKKARREERRKTVKVVEFRLADEHYAVECTYVREVYPIKTLTPVPGTPDFTAGIINVRGEIISVVDLKKFFQLPQKYLTDLPRVIILALHTGEIDMEFGILAEEVPGTLNIPVRDIHPLLPTLTGIRALYVKGVAKNRLVVLDAVKLLSDKKMIVRQEAEG